MARDLFNRYMWLADTIYKAKRITFAELNRKWENSNLSDGNVIPLRTFHNHKKAIEELFDIVIQCDGRTNEYYIEDTQGVGDKTLIHWLLNSFSISNVIRDSRSIQERIILEDIPSAHEYLSNFVDAMRDNRIVKVWYRSFFQDKTIEIELYPYFVKLFNRRWYVFGRTAKEELVKVYALDRVENMIIKGESFEYPSDFLPENHLLDSFGIMKMADVVPVDIILKAYKEHPKYLRALPLHHSQIELEKSDDYSLFKFRLAPTYDFYQDIFSRRENVEIVSPPEVRNEFKRILTQIAKYYGD